MRYALVLSLAFLCSLQSAEAGLKHRLKTIFTAPVKPAVYVFWDSEHSQLVEDPAAAGGLRWRNPGDHRYAKFFKDSKVFGRTPEAFRRQKLAEAESYKAYCWEMYMAGGSESYFTQYHIACDQIRLLKEFEGRM